MPKKFAVAFEYDLERGICHLAKEVNKDHEQTDKVALFDSEEQARKWVEDGNVDDTCFDVNYVEISV